MSVHTEKIEVGKCSMLRTPYKHGTSLHGISKTSFRKLKSAELIRIPGYKEKEEFTSKILPSFAAHRILFAHQFQEELVS